MKMITGMEEKAKRGEFRKQLLPGYTWNKTGRIVKDPNNRIGEAIDQVFKKFQEIQSARETFLWFHSQNIELPVIKDRAWKKGIVWQLPKKALSNRHCKILFMQGLTFGAGM